MSIKKGLTRFFGTIQIFKVTYMCIIGYDRLPNELLLRPMNMLDKRASVTTMAIA